MDARITLQRDIEALFAADPDVLYGFADIGYSPFAEQYRVALVFAVPYGKQFTPGTYTEQDFEDGIQLARARLEAILARLEALLTDRRTAYYIPPVAQANETELLAPFSFKYAATRAGIGIAIGAGTDVAIDAADVVLMQSRLSDVPAAIRLSRATLRNIHENLFWAFIYNIIGIPLAAGLFIPIFGWTLNPMFGAAAMSLSSFCVVSNALRLNLFKLRDPSNDRRKSGKRFENRAIEPEAIRSESPSLASKQIEVRLRIEGMMCGHCEARVKKALENVDGVVSATASYKEGIAIVQADGNASLEKMKQVVEAEDYRVV